MRYSDGFRTRMIERMLGPDAVTPDQLAVEVGVGKTTLWKWRKEVLDSRKTSSNQRPRPSVDKKGQQWSARDKLRVVLAAAALGENKLGAFLRQQGLTDAQLELWKKEVFEELDEAAQNKREAKRKAQADERRINELKRELTRKERALSEAAALLLLQKKVQQIWGDEDDDTPSKTEP